MKTLIYLAFAALALNLHAEVTPKKSATDSDETPVLDPTPYAFNRYDRLMSKSPFDFDVPPPPPVEEINPFQDWALAGITKSTDYLVAIIVNLKTSERLRLTKYATPPSAKANQTKSGGDVFTLETLEFEDGKPTNVRSAKAIVTKNGTMGKVIFDSKVLQMKPAAGGMVPGGMRGGAPGGGNIPGVPGQQAGQGSNAALMNMLQQRNGTQPNQGGQPQQNGIPQPNGQPQQLNGAFPQNNSNPLNIPQPTATPTPAQPVQPQVFNNTGGGSNPSTPVLNIPQPNGGGGNSGGNANGGNNGGGGPPNMPVRRRVVLPVSDGAPAVPTVPNP
jgi:hypothetical protein